MLRHPLRGRTVSPLLQIVLPAPLAKGALNALLACATKPRCVKRKEGPDFLSLSFFLTSCNATPFRVSGLHVRVIACGRCAPFAMHGLVMSLAVWRPELGLHACVCVCINVHKRFSHSDTRRAPVYEFLLLALYARTVCCTLQACGSCSCIAVTCSAGGGRCRCLPPLPPHTETRESLINAKD